MNVAGSVMDRAQSQVDFISVSFDQTTGGSRNTTETINASGTTKIRGIEADLTVSPLPGLSLTGSYAYTYTRVPPVRNPFTGVKQNVYIVYTPRNAASGTINYAVPLAGARLNLHLDGNYAQATQTFDQYARKNEASFIVNARVALADIAMPGGADLTLSLWSRNLLNEIHVYRVDPSNGLGSLPAAGSTSSSLNNVLGDLGYFNAPRTFGAEATIRF